jgi:hypothetical protein
VRDCVLLCLLPGFPHYGAQLDVITIVAFQQLPDAPFSLVSRSMVEVLLVFLLPPDMLHLLEIAAPASMWFISCCLPIAFESIVIASNVIRAECDVLGLKPS